MITEDYVSFEIAKLLKEKGFIGDGDIGCRCGFYKQDKSYPSQINLVYDDLNNSELEWNECLRFTLQMAMKWLREVHNIFIIIDYVFLNKASFEYKYEIHNMCKGHSIAISEFRDDYKTYESACEAACIYVLKNLI